MCRLEIKQAVEGGHHVPGLVEAKVTSMEEVWDVLQAGSSSRTVGSTRANDHSSRSHWYDNLDCLTAYQSFHEAHTCPPIVALLQMSYKY